MKAFELENPVLTLRGDLLGGGRNLLTGSWANDPSSCVHHPSNKQINDENLPLHQFGLGGRGGAQKKLPRNLCYDDKYC